MMEKPAAAHAARGLLLRFALGAVAAACAVTGCIFLPYGSAKTTAPVAEPLATEVVQQTPDIPLKLVCSSVELDLTIEVRNEADLVVTGSPFAVTITPTEGEATRAVDEDMDGVIAVDELAAGTYTVTLDAIDGFAVPAPTEATVAPRVERVVVDVSDKVVSASEVDASTEDAQYGNGGGADNSANAAEETVPTAPVTPVTPEPAEPTDPTDPTEPTDPTFPDNEWQSLGGDIYYIGQDGNKLTGIQNIAGTAYRFDANGVLEGTVGIDVSTWQEDINWAKVKASGISFVIIRLGYRGYGTGKLVLDDMYESHIQGALAAGLKVGVYFFTEAVSVEEAIEEASMCVQYVSGYHISYPIAIDTEYVYDSSCVPRANPLSVEQRTKICKAFCDTVCSAGYTPAIYASASWLHHQLDLSQLTAYMTWLAHYTEKTDYADPYGIWQYTSEGRVDGISGRVDLNISYLEAPPTATPITPAEPETTPEANSETTPEVTPETESVTDPAVVETPASRTIVPPPATTPTPDSITPEGDEGVPDAEGVPETNGTENP